ncbi:MAG: hypothetical protein SFY56_14715 [Bacteroidota bacterium]|nr:hypothetical protein [Bacteroidota bacterium]
MKKLPIYLLGLFSLFNIQLNAQDLIAKINHSLTDSIPNKNNPKHDTIRHSLFKNASLIGNYLSFGLGTGSSRGNTSGALFFNYSLAIKSHLVSFSYGYVPGFTASYHRNYYSANYAGLLFGESLRLKNFFLSLSAGISNSYVASSKVTQNGVLMERFGRKGISFPIEMKFYIHLYNGIGLGYTNTTDIASGIVVNYSNFSIILGVWNKIPRK